MSWCSLPSKPFLLAAPPAVVLVLLLLWRAVLCSLWPGSPSWLGRDPGQTLALPWVRAARGHQLNAGIGGPLIPQTLPAPLQFPSWSPDLRHLPHFTRSVSFLCFLRTSPFPTLALHPLGWQQAPPVAITTSSSPAKWTRPWRASPPASTSPPRVRTCSLPPQAFTICLQEGDGCVWGAAGPLRPPRASFPLCRPPAGSTHMTWTTFTVPRALQAKAPLFWPKNPMQIELWIHESGRIAWNTVKKMCPMLCPGLVWRLEGKSPQTCRGGKCKILKQSHWVSLPQLWTSSPARGAGWSLSVAAGWVSGAADRACCSCRDQNQPWGPCQTQKQADSHGGFSTLDRCSLLNSSSTAGSLGRLLPPGLATRTCDCWRRPRTASWAEARLVGHQEPHRVLCHLITSGCQSTAATALPIASSMPGCRSGEIWGFHKKNIKSCVFPLWASEPQQLLSSSAVFIPLTRCLNTAKETCREFVPKKYSRGCFYILQPLDICNSSSLTEVK